MSLELIVMPIAGALLGLIAAQIVILARRIEEVHSGVDSLLFLGQRFVMVERDKVLPHVYVFHTNESVYAQYIRSYDDDDVLVRETIVLNLAGCRQEADYAKRLVTSELHELTHWATPDMSGNEIENGDGHSAQWEEVLGAEFDYVHGLD